MTAVLRPPLRLVSWLAASWRRAGALVGVMAVSMWAVFAIDAEFLRRTGAPTPDTQNALTLPQATGQLAAWDDGTARLYAGFAAVDFVFPLAASLVLAVVAHRLVVLGERWPGPAVPRGVALVCLLPALFDYAENVGFLAALATGDELPVQVALVAKSLELATIGLSGGLLAVLAAVLAARFVALRLVRRDGVRGDGRRAGSSAHDPAS
ncbi:MAG: hypothetical protein AVDCRST_MAG66-511 [uncultured Pseudonocardia sp.]|uniref:Uncharacterized protein n=1 Tax=uncultured Pseudonocardia sp. TaxID=211455 RepID=A0A6J4NCL3_9PSEU|nr:MAG: hypothetical protein AVDCRST_MAG66-511 [uncultured Pseudonocardia sp.]